jgi:hypothetical protein
MEGIYYTLGLLFFFVLFSIMDEGNDDDPNDGHPFMGP